MVQPLVAGGVEMLVGSSGDPRFGPLVVCGLGGTAAEIHHDVAVRLTPLTDRDAHAMLRELRMLPLLQGYRGAPPCDIAAVEGLVLRVAAMVHAHPQIAELDCNPVSVSADGVVVLDARVRVAQPAPRSRGPPSRRCRRPSTGSPSPREGGLLLASLQRGARHRPGAPREPRAAAAIEEALAERDWLGCERRTRRGRPRRSWRLVHTARARRGRPRAVRGRRRARSTPTRSSCEAPTRRRCTPPAAPARWRGRCSPARRRRGFCAVRPPGHHAERRRGRWASACSTTSRSPPSWRSASSGRAGVRSSTGTSTTATAPTTSSARAPTSCSRASTRRDLYPGTGPPSDAARAPGEGYTINLPVPAGTGEELGSRCSSRSSCPRSSEFQPRPGPRLGRLRRPPRRPARRLRADEAVLRRDGPARCARSPRRWGRRSARCSRAATTLAGARRLVAATMEALADETAPGLGASRLPHLARGRAGRPPLDPVTPAGADDGRDRSPLATWPR